MQEDSNCLFCKIIRRKIPSKVAYEDDSVFAFHDIAPQAPTHILIVPKEHIATLNDLDERYEALVGKMVMAARRLAAEAGISESGYRCVLNCNRGAGQSVFHIHLHLLGGRAMGWPPG
ncbi:histidine triad nucleotide-binding protein [Candidatus Sumerlaeota bacterium]|nr:histidine triad nucleotide-binding protein [Candidatus Sumerlaeota bacterium]